MIFKLLAAHSPYFRAFFFEDRFRECQTQTFEINDNEVDVEMFGVMLSCIYPDNGKPNGLFVMQVLGGGQFSIFQNTVQAEYIPTKHRLDK
jgi:hypothetical protein